MPRTPRAFAVSVPLLMLLSSSACSRGNSPDTGHPASGQLFKAAAQGGLAEVSSLIEQGADVNENVGTQAAPLTPLLAALTRENDAWTASRVAVLLVEHGARIHQSYKGYSARDLAIYLGVQPALKSMDRVPRRASAIVSGGAQ